MVSKQATNEIVLPELRIEAITLHLKGMSPLICHSWSQKAKLDMLNKQMKKANTGKAAKDPFREFADSLYWVSPKPEDPTEEDVASGVFGFPSVAFKNAAVDACSQVAGLTKVFTRGAFHVNRDSEFVSILGTPEVREDPVRVGMGTADLRYRAMFTDWECYITVEYNVQVISAEQIANLFRIAGYAVGIGDWRPQKDGSYGTFTVI